MELQITSFTFNPFQENAWVLWDETKSCIIIDPGCSNREEQGELVEFLSQNQLKPSLVLNTHCHLDHIFGNRFLKSHYYIPIWAPKGEEQNLKMAEASARLYGIPNFEPSPEPDSWIEAGQKIEFGNTSLDSLFVPGHTAGHLAFFHSESKVLISGDVLFYDSIGRTDFPGGSHSVLMNSIFKTLFPLGDAVQVCSGHGPNTTLGRERKLNPFLLDHV